MHPNREDLKGFVTGTLLEERADVVADHVQQCSRCEETLSELEAASDTFIQPLKQPRVVDPHRGEADCRRLLSAIEAIGHEPSFDTPNHAPSPTEQQAEMAPIGPYKLLARLGQGGMGTVYKALHTRLQKVVAIKVLSADRMQNPEALARFEREMVAVGKLAHPNIVAAHDAGDVDGTHFLVMEYVEGINLSQLVRRVGPLGVAAACELVRQAAVGLQHAHQHGMVHRDIKPSNLLLAFGGGQTLRQEDDASAQCDSPPIVKILDLGLALLDETHLPEDRELTSTGQLMGTLDYMAPEQGADTHRVDIRADIYSLGATLYKLLAGVAPFSGEKYDTPMKVMRALATQNAPSIREKRQDLPPALVVIVDRMLSADPSERFSTPAEVAAALEPFARDADLPALAQSALAAASVDPAAAKTAPQAAAAMVDTTRDEEPSLPAAQRSSAPAGSRGSARRRILTVAGLLGPIVLLAVILTLQFGTGTVVIETPDGALPDEVEIVVSQDGRVIEVIDVNDGWRITLKGGRYHIALSAGSDRFQLKGNRLTVKRFQRNIVTIEQKPAVADAQRPPPLAAETALADIPEPPPLDEWLKGRKLLTVAQDGSGMFRTIQAALDALKPGQVVMVLDKGPYREELFMRGPVADVGLVSKVGTRIEVPNWTRWASGVVDQKKNIYQGAHFSSPQGFRISGFEFVSPDAPTDSERAIVLHLGVAGEVVVENCRILRSPRYTGSPRTNQQAVGSLHAIGAGWQGSGIVPNTRYTFRDNYLEGLLDLTHDFAAPVVIKRNYIVQGDDYAILLPLRSGTTVVRHNVIRGSVGIVLRSWEAERDAQQAAEQYLIANNAFDVVNSPVLVDGACRSIRIQNNMIRSRIGSGIEVHLNDQTAKKDDWQIGHNSYATQPVQGGTNTPLLSKRPTDLVLRSQSLSTDPQDSDYLRIAADSPLATAGAGGELPAYIGAFPPGPPPAEGDWFTRLQASPPLAAEAALADIPEPPPLGQWLKGREVITVAQDGSGDYQTILEAVEALKPGHVIKVLDKGPYRERFDKLLPADVALISQVGTRIELPNWWRSRKSRDGTGWYYRGLVLRCSTGLRIAGFEFAAPEPRPDAYKARVLNLHIAGDVVVERCRIVHPGRPPGRLSGDDLLTSFVVVGPDSIEEGARLFVTDNDIEGNIGIQNRISTVVIERNFIRSGKYAAISPDDRFPKLVIRHNVILGAMNGIGFGHRVVPPTGSDSTDIEITHNTIDVGGAPIWIRWQELIPNGATVILRNNILASQQQSGISFLRGSALGSRLSRQLGYNAYLANPRPRGRGYEVVPPQASDVFVPMPFLSNDPAAAGYARIAAEGPLATAGVDGTHIGAFPPGPAPGEGDWFTRLQAATVLQPSNADRTPQLVP